MVFWIIAALISLAVAALLAAPLLQRTVTAGGARDVAIYRDQLAEVDRDLARGLLDPAEAERTRTEIALRLLAADRAARPGTGAAPAGATRGLTALVAVLVVAGTLFAYDRIGTPGYRDLPLADRLAAAEARLASLPAQAAAEAEAADLLAGVRIQPPPEIAATVEQVRATVAENPDAIGDLMLLRDFEAGTRNFAEAARLSERILDALGADAALSDLLVQIELMVLATNGVVSDEAAAVLGRAVAMSPDHPGVLFYRGLLMSNIGRPDLAFALWRPLAEATDAPTPYSDRARQLIGDVAWAAGVDYALPALPGPSQADLEAAAAMDPEAQTEMARGMVARLSDRLAAQGGTAEEWARLLRGLGVLGETDRAAAIWAEAQTNFAGQPGLETIRAAAVAAGVAE